MPGVALHENSGLSLLQFLYYRLSTIGCRNVEININIIMYTLMCILIYSLLNLKKKNISEAEFHWGSCSRYR